jgi:hypothetical protein
MLSDRRNAMLMRTLLKFVKENRLTSREKAELAKLLKERRKGLEEAIEVLDRELGTKPKPRRAKR